MSPSGRLSSEYQPVSQEDRARQEATAAAGLYDDVHPPQADEEDLKSSFGGWNMLLFFFPAFCDMAGTTVSPMEGFESVLAH